MKNRKRTFPWTGENAAGTVIMFLSSTHGVLLYIDDKSLVSMENKLVYNVPIKQFKKFEGTVELNF